MYDAMRSSGGIYALYFVAVIAFGNIVMLNLFLAILLGNFDRARDFGGKKKLIECFLELRDINGRASERAGEIFAIAKLAKSRRPLLCLSPFRATVARACLIDLVAAFMSTTLLTWLSDDVVFWFNIDCQMVPIKQRKGARREEQGPVT